MRAFRFRCVQTSKRENLYTYCAKQSKSFLGGLARGWGTINLGVAFWIVECAARTGNRKLTDVVKLLKEFHDKRIFAADRYYLFADGTMML